MAEKLTEFPENWKPENFTGKKEKAGGEAIVTESGNKYDFTCHKIVNQTNTFVTLYGQLNEATAVKQWGVRRYATILIKNGEALMTELDGPRSY